MRFSFTTFTVSVAPLTGCTNQGVYTVVNPSKSEIIAQNIQAPIAKKEPYQIIDGDTRVDNYWMRDDSRTNSEILTHLEQENSMCLCS